MTDDAAFDTRRKQLLYRALAEFSDTCDLPALTPSCPFFQRQPNGDPICGEECKDILGDELSHAVEPHTLTLGADLAATRGPRRPRPRRGPAKEQVSFDARQIYLTARDRDVSSWGMTSLINGLRYQLGWMSRDADDPPRIDRATEIMQVLEHRGVDPAAVVRQGLFRYISSSVIWHIINALPKGSDDLGWVALIREIAPDFDHIVANAEAELDRVIDMVEPYLSAWILRADIEDLLEHRVRASAAELRRHWETDLPPRDFDTVWLVDRFTKTYMENWGRRSLQREWRYIHSQHPAPCPPADMRERVVDVKSLAVLLAEIGSRHIEDQGNQSATGSKKLIQVEQFLPLAVEALKRGDRDEAASIYRMLFAVRPDDHDVVNNLGFCILPDQPAEAVRYLEKATETASPGPHLAMTYLNLALARYVLSDIAGARTALAHSREHNTEGFFCYMWDISRAASGAWVISDIHGSLRNYSDSLEELLDLAS